MIKISVLYRHESRYEEFIGHEITSSDDGNLFLIYNEDGNLIHIIPFDAVASIDIDYIEEEKEEELTNPIDTIGYHPCGIAPHTYTFHKDNYWDNSNG